MRISNKGFSLVELIVALGLSSIVIASAMQVNKMMNSSIGQSDSRLGRLKLMGDMRSTVLRRESCIATMNGYEFRPTQDTDVSLRFDSGQVMSSAAGQNEPLGYGIKILSLQLKQKRHVTTLITGEVYSAFLQAEVASLTEPDTVLRPLPVSTMYLLVNASGQVTDCLIGETPLDTLTLGCQALGGRIVDGRCVLSSNRVEVMCPEGQHLAGFTQEGLPSCAAMPRSPASGGYTCTRTPTALGPGSGATPRVFGIHSCNISCIGTYGAFALCASDCNPGVRGWMFCGNCVRETMSCR